MSTSLVINGTSYTFPELGDKDWGINVTAWATAVSSGLLQKSAGTFSLTDELDLGASYGLKSTYFKSRSSNIASDGNLRLSNSDGIAWRNTANDDDLWLDTTDDDLFWNSEQINGKMADPMTGIGDIIVNSAGRDPSRLAIGTEGQILKVVSGTPAWDDESAASPEYASRGDAAAYDFAWGTIPSQVEGSWHELDLSSIIPAGAKGNLVTLVIELDTNVNGIEVWFSENGYTNDINKIIVKQPDASMPVYKTLDVVTDVDGKIQYYLGASGPGVYSTLNIAVRGWWV